MMIMLLNNLEKLEKSYHATMLMIWTFFLFVIFRTKLFNVYKIITKSLLT